MNRVIPCQPSSTSRPSNWPVTPEVAGSSPVAPVSSFALQIPYSVVLIGTSQAIPGSKRAARLSVASEEKPWKRAILRLDMLSAWAKGAYSVYPGNATSRSSPSPSRA